jgi:plasmid stability protein
MKTTIDLPDDLVLKLKLRALREGRKLKDAAADLLARALSDDAQQNRSMGPPVAKCLPLIKLRPVDPPSGKPPTAQEFSDFIKDIEQQHEIERYESTFGHQYVDRADG